MLLPVALSETGRLLSSVWKIRLSHTGLASVAARRDSRECIAPDRLRSSTQVLPLQWVTSGLPARACSTLPLSGGWSTLGATLLLSGPLSNSPSPRPLGVRRQGAVCPSRIGGIARRRRAGEKPNVRNVGDHREVGIRNQPPIRIPV